MMVSLTAGGLPSVRIILAAVDVPAGVSWTVTASYQEAGRTVSYRPRGGRGVGTGDQVVLTDPAAPIRTPITYRVSTGATATIVRTAPAADLLVDMQGSTWAVFQRAAAGGDQRTPEPRHWVSDVPASSMPPVRSAPVAGKAAFQMGAVTSGAGTWGVRDLVAANRPVVVLHACDMPDCDVPRSETVIITSAPSDRRTPGLPERAWTLSRRPVADPEPDTVVAINTWDDVEAAGLTWDQLDALGLSWDLFDLTDWDAM